MISRTSHEATDVIQWDTQKLWPNNQSISLFIVSQYFETILSTGFDKTHNDRTWAISLWSNKYFQVELMEKATGHNIRSALYPVTWLDWTQNLCLLQRPFIHNGRGSGEVTN